LVHPTLLLAATDAWITSLHLGSDRFGCRVICRTPRSAAGRRATRASGPL